MTETSSKIILSRGQIVIIDAEDYERVSKLKWWADHYGYAVARSKMVKGKFESYRMHRLILNAPKGMEVDHINGNKLDNRKSNLRLATKAENGRNRPTNSNNTSGYKGVTRGPNSIGWVAQIKVNKKKIHLGYFQDPADAYRAYIDGVKKYHGEFGNIKKRHT